MHKLVTKCMNVSLGRWESFWGVEHPSLVRLEDDEDMPEKMVFTMANAVSACLVSHCDR